MRVFELLCGKQLDSPRGKGGVEFLGRATGSDSCSQVTVALLFSLCSLFCFPSSRMVLQSSRQDCREKKSRAQSRAAAWATLETSWARLSRESPPSAGNSAHMVAQYSSSVGHDQAGGKTRAEGLWKCFFGRGILCLVFVFGCSPVTPNLTEKDNFLARPQMNPGSCAVEIFFVRFPVSSPLGNDELWREIDETRVPAEARQLLWANGLRAGVVGAGLTPGIVSLLD